MNRLYKEIDIPHRRKKLKLPNIEEQYRAELLRIRNITKKLINTYTSPEFKELKEWLKRNVPENEANRIMDDNL